jgi:photosystem II stability/assembly factor-like uncharacterized protein
MIKKILFLTLLLASCNVLFSQTNWELLNPKPTPNTGKNIEFVSSTIGYIITSNELLETLDAGTTWLKKQNISSGNDISIKNGIGYIVGNNGYVLKSIDNGASWQLISTGFFTSFNTVNIIDNDTIILSSSYGLVKTIDGGATWSSINISGVTIVKTAFTSSLVGHAVCANGKIQKTIDGGLNWYNTYSTNIFPSNFLTVHFINPNVGFASREHDNLFKTTNGGETWTEIIGSFEPIYDFHFLNQNNGFATGDHGATYKTTNGGTTWSQIFFQNGYIYNTAMYGIFFHDNNVGFATGARGRIIKTVDGGNTWTQNSPTYDDIKQLQIVNNSIGYAQIGTSFYKTNDFGDNWSVVGSLSVGTSVGIGNFTFVNETLGYATTSGTYGGQVYKTTDGGVSWTVLNNGLDIIDEGIASICFLNSTTGFISGGFNQKKVMKTTNGGATWTQVSNQLFGNIQFVTSLVGYGNRIGNYYGAMYKTTDGGSTWNLSIELQGESINSFHFLDENNGYFVGDDSLFYKTTDGGTTWQQQTVPYGYYDLTKFYSTTIGYIVDENGVIYKTENGGENWTQIASQNSLNSIELVNNYVFTAGTYGKIYRSYSGIPVLNTTDVQMEQQISVYPNPTFDYLNVKLDESNQVESFELFNVEGRFFYPKIAVQTNESIKLDVSHFSTGLYFLKVNFTNNKSVIKKVLIKE